MTILFPYFWLTTTFVVLIPVSIAMATVTTTKRNSWLVVDFDGTCTIKDTTPLLPKLAATSAGDDDSQRQSRLATFAALEQEFFGLYAEAKNAAMDNEQLSLDEALDLLDGASNTVTKKINESGCLSGLPQCSTQMQALINSNDDISEALSLHNNCVSTVAKAHRSGWNLGILSINWSRPLIGAALVQPVKQYLGKETTDEHELEVEIWSNDIDSKGVVTLDVPGASAKKACIAKLKRRVHASQPSSIVVYIGDSSTDLSGLIEADVGIFLGNSKSTFEIAENWGVNFVPLLDRKRTRVDLMDETSVWKTDNWEDIERLLNDLALCDEDEAQV